MGIDDVPAALQARLGPEATGGLLQLLDRSHRQAREDVITACTERFERRLVEEVSGLRIQIAQVESTLRQEMVAMGAALRQEMAAMGAALRQEMAAMGATLRQEMAAMGATLRQEMTDMGADLRQDMMSMEGRLRGDIAAGRVEFIKWSFLFWVGQVFAVTGIMGVMLRLFR